MQFRDATEQDLAAIVALLADDILGAQRELVAEPLPNEYAAAFQELSQQAGNRLIVAEDEAQRIVGCLQLTITPGIARRGAKRATIEGVRVAANTRGSGLGAQIIKYAIDQARCANCHLVQLTTDKTRPDAHRFYENLGFLPSHIGMKLNLSE
ncbi:MAG: GNAT family N-acetyltransferase [Pseudomonadota bacterium]